MARITRYSGRIRLSFVKVALAAIVVNLFFLPSYPLVAVTPELPPPLYVHDVYLNEQAVGTTDDIASVTTLLREARRNLAASSDELVLVEGELTYRERELLEEEEIDSEELILTRMVNILGGNVRETLHRSYTVKINDFVVSLASKDEVIAMLQAVIDKYDEERLYEVTLAVDSERELSVLTARIERRQAEQEDEGENGTPGIKAGLTHVTDHLFATAEPLVEKEFADYDNGLIAIYFADTVGVVEAYLASSELVSLDYAIEEITKEDEKPKIYEVVSGDTLSGISLKTNTPMDRIIELNDSLVNEYSLLRIGDQLTIMVPEPELVIVRKEERYIEEYYNEDIIYIPIEEWYTTQMRTIQEPSAGVRHIAAITTFHNDIIYEREILKEEVVYQAVPRIVERGTRIPPTYIKPLSGGRLASGYGPRVAPTRGASTYHRGVDWGTPTGTPIFASSGGVVSRAGWGSGYGYVVYIDHPDGRQTRYAHLSRILVSVGQHVSQRERIALSGNTGISTGPHLHFEILINGRQVNPLRYLN
ncbi:MAG: M23 family metallopeptidase [Lachnospiraceae bacterium]|jgi:murein DD-endopeptidase MepM/ murein hydrolase activator NlpD|nr:M23 family metallopeptidase [Lachnospiraceae bacterium]